MSSQKSLTPEEKRKSDEAVQMVHESDPFVKRLKTLNEEFPSTIRSARDHLTDLLGKKIEYGMDEVPVDDLLLKELQGQYHDWQITGIERETEEASKLIHAKEQLDNLMIPLTLKRYSTASKTLKEAFPDYENALEGSGQESIANQKLSAIIQDTAVLKKLETLGIAPSLTVMDSINTFGIIPESMLIAFNGPAKPTEKTIQEAKATIERTKLLLEGISAFIKARLGAASIDRIIELIRNHSYHPEKNGPLPPEAPSPDSRISYI